MNLFLVDGIGPFLRQCNHRRINWSKISFECLESGDGLDPIKFRQIKHDFYTFIQKTSSLGFNAVTLDDVAHLSVQPEYAESLKQTIVSYRKAYVELFDIAEEFGMDVYLTSDVMFYPVDKGTVVSGDKGIQEPSLPMVLSDIFESFPQVRGVILRIGECDGVDVRERFRSKLTLKTPEQAHTLIKELLPLFEKYNRKLVFRTWTVGAHRVGDLIWNRNTFDRVFSGIESPNLIISLKYGESDFFRYIPLNKLFFHSNHQKIIELQARREYEGSGQYPSFVGWDYEQYIRQLDGAENVIGAWIWVQTGGWSVFKRITYIDSGAIWNEINAFVTMCLVKDSMGTEEAVRLFSLEQLKNPDWCKLLVFLRLSDEVIKELLYIDQIARQKLFFRRVRVPTLLSVFWDQIMINHSMRKLLRCLVKNPDEIMCQSYTALRKISVMKKLAAELELPVDDIDFLYDTFEILAVAREYYFGDFGMQITDRLEELNKAYKMKYSTRYTLRMDFTPFKFPRRRIGLLLLLWMRKRRGYRMVDRVLMIKLLAWFSPVFFIARHKANSVLLKNRAMGIDTIFK